jgi:citrate synthase
MSSHDTGPTTSIARYDAAGVYIREKSLADDLIGKISFTQMIFLEITGREPTPAETEVLDACLVTLVEHGMTPSALVARMTLTGAPDALQGAVAAGLLGIGNVYVGAMEGCGELLGQLVPADDPRELATKLVSELRASGARVPGFGHPHHKPDDPRALRLLEVADRTGVAGAHVAVLRTLAEVVDEVYGRHITINATGAIAALLADCDVPLDALRGFAVVSRSAGLVGHLVEERRRPAGDAIWHAGEAAVPYVAGDGTA